MNLSKLPIIRSYSGYLNQSEFLERYFIIKRRLGSGLTREELAFLLGRSPYFIIDYEELSTVKFELVDAEVAGSILTQDRNETLSFDAKDGVYNISHERRLVRVIRSEYMDHINYEFQHHWKIAGENRPLRIVEPIICTATIAPEAMKLITKELNNLLQLGYFKSKRSPLEIQQRVWGINKYISDAWSVVFLKNIIYNFIRDDKLAVAYDKRRFTYHERSL